MTAETPQQTRARFARVALKFEKLAQESAEAGRTRAAGCFNHLARKARNEIWESHIAEQRNHYGPRIYDAIQNVAEASENATIGSPFNA